MNELKAAISELKELSSRLNDLVASVESLVGGLSSSPSESSSAAKSKLVQVAISEGAVPVGTRPRKGCPVHGLSNYAEFPNRKGFYYCKEYSPTQTEWTKSDPWKSRDGSIVRYYCKSVWKG
ncbi:MAG: hypothetical protein QXF26_09765 [Candidatus Bathyarchaeia archaeon]